LSAIDFRTTYIDKNTMQETVPAWCFFLYTLVLSNFLTLLLSDSPTFSLSYFLSHFPYKNLIQRWQFFLKSDNWRVGLNELVQNLVGLDSFV
jgi:hypothetical protein